MICTILNVQLRLDLVTILNKLINEKEESI